MYKNTQCKLQAHRGVSVDAPENTLSAFSEAVKQGYDIIEFDPKFTRDGVCVVLHDKTLNRTGRKNGEKFTFEKKIAETDFSELKDVEVGSWFSARFSGEKIPTLDEALSFMSRAGIEAKIDNIVQTFTPDQREVVYNSVEKYGLPGKTGLTCSDLAVLKEFAARFPLAPLHYDGETSDENLDELYSFARGRDVTVWARFDNALTSWCRTTAVSEQSAKKIRSRFKLGLWILSDDGEMLLAKKFNPDVVETTGGIKP